MDRTTGLGRGALIADGVEFDARDVSLLREIDRTGSVAEASSELGRSRARALSRIETLEDAFGELVERMRGGSGGGGSRLTPNGSELLDRYDRLQAALDATARVPETVLSGTVAAIEGELATVETDVGAVRGLHHGVSTGESVQVRIGADAVTVLDPGGEPGADSTSARNRLSGTVTALDRGETVDTVGIDVDGISFRALVTGESTERLGLRNGREVVLTWKATATRLTAKTR
jgi:molybdate transport system regulatory protein